MRRRAFLRRSGTAAAVAAGGIFGILKYPRGARAAGWGAWPADKMDAILPVDRRSTNVLELHINGGMSAFDTFYTVPTWGTANFQYVNQYAPGNPVESQPDRNVRFEECGYGNAPADLWESASAVGFHPASARPLAVTVDQNSLLNELLARPGVADHEAFDAAITYYRQEYENRFRAGGLGTATRSPERGNYEFSDFARRNAAHLQDILPASLFAEIAAPNPPVCNDAQQPFDMPRMQARLAASLLTRETDQARYVLWIDTGIRPAVNGGHDTHFFHTQYASQNVPHTMAALAEIIGDGPGQIDLDQTMIVINTEFGRTPGRQDEIGGTGTNHWPQGYVTVFIGGTIQDRGVYGAIRESDGHADNTIMNGYVTPAENRIMVLQSLGIYPFSSQSFAVGDVRGGVEDELEAATRVRNEYLGVVP